MRCQSTFIFLIYQSIGKTDVVIIPNLSIFFSHFKQTHWKQKVIKVNNAAQETNNWPN